MAAKIYPSADNLYYYLSTSSSYFYHSTQVWQVIFHPVLVFDVFRPVHASYIFPQYWHRIFSAQNWQLIFLPQYILYFPSSDIYCSWFLRLREIHQVYAYKLAGCERWFICTEDFEGPIDRNAHEAIGHIEKRLNKNIALSMGTFFTLTLRSLVGKFFYGHSPLD